MLIRLKYGILFRPDPEPVIIPDSFKLPDISTLTALLEVPIATFPPSNILKQVLLSSWISSISCAPVWLIITAGPVPSFVIFNCSVVFWTVFTCSKEPLIFKLPSILTLPETCNFVSEFGSIVPIPTLLLLASIYNTPESILTLLLASIITAPPEHIKLVDLIEPITFKILLSQVKFADCIKAPVALPTNNWLATKVPVPVPPRAIAKVPSDMFVAFKFVKLAPDPLNNVQFILPLTSNA